MAWRKADYRETEDVMGNLGEVTWGGQKDAKETNVCPSTQPSQRSQAEVQAGILGREVKSLKGYEVWYRQVKEHAGK